MCIEVLSRAKESKVGLLDLAVFKVVTFNPLHPRGPFPAQRKYFNDKNFVMISVLSVKM